MTIVQGTFGTTLYEDLKKYFNDYYDGKVKRCCDEDCPVGCNGDHYSEFVTEFRPFFKELS